MWLNLHREKTTKKKGRANSHSSKREQTTKYSIGTMTTRLKQSKLSWVSSHLSSNTNANTNTNTTQIGNDTDIHMALAHASASNPASSTASAASSDSTSSCEAGAVSPQARPLKRKLHMSAIPPSNNSIGTASTSSLTTGHRQRKRTRKDTKSESSSSAAATTAREKVSRAPPTTAACRQASYITRVETFVATFEGCAMDSIAIDAANVKSSSKSDHDGPSPDGPGPGHQRNKHHQTWHDIALSLIHSVMHHRSGSVFLHTPDIDYVRDRHCQFESEFDSSAKERNVEYLQQFHTMTTRPICLRDIEHSLSNNAYTSFGAFLHDIKLVFDNALRFFSPKHRTYKAADRMLRWLDGQCSQLVKHVSKREHKCCIPLEQHDTSQHTMSSSVAMQAPFSSSNQRAVRTALLLAADTPMSLPEQSVHDETMLSESAAASNQRHTVEPDVESNGEHAQLAQLSQLSHHSTASHTSSSSSLKRCHARSGRELMDSLASSQTATEADSAADPDLQSSPISVIGRSLRRTAAADAKNGIYIAASDELDSEHDGSWSIAAASDDDTSYHPDDSCDDDVDAHADTDAHAAADVANVSDDETMTIRVPIPLHSCDSRNTLVTSPHHTLNDLHCDTTTTAATPTATTAEHSNVHSSMLATTPQHTPSSLLFPKMHRRTSSAATVAVSETEPDSLPPTPLISPAYTPGPQQSSVSKRSTSTTTTTAAAAAAEESSDSRTVADSVRDDVTPECTPPKRGIVVTAPVSEPSPTALYAYAKTQQKSRRTRRQKFPSWLSSAQSQTARTLSPSAASEYIELISGCATGFSQYHHRSVVLDRLECSLHTTMGHFRQCNQDHFAVETRFGPDTFMFGVFDGHGRMGETASQIAAKLVPLSVGASIRSNCIPTALASAFQEAHESLLTIAHHEASNTNMKNADYGTTGVFCVQHDGTLHVANAGDTRCLVMYVQRDDCRDGADETEAKLTTASDGESDDVQSSLPSFDSLPLPKTRVADASGKYLFGAVDDDLCGSILRNVQRSTRRSSKHSKKYRLQSGPASSDHMVEAKVNTGSIRGKRRSRTRRAADVASSSSPSSPAPAVHSPVACWYQVTRDHNPSHLADERQRIKANGGALLNTKTEIRVYPGDRTIAEARADRLTLNMTRALGHRILSQYGISPNPEVHQIPIPPNADIYVVVASDGVWDVMHNQDVIEILIERIDDLASACEHIMLESERRWVASKSYGDNITLAISKFAATMS
jgi:serine/threonine protein phosphatase PrpC